jgi:transcriptional regulator with XRE-family HTH domain
MALAQRLRDERRIRGWTLDDLAERAGVSKSLLSKIERDQVSPSLRTLKALADGLDLPLAWLLHENHLEQFIVRKDQRRQFVVPGSEIRREIIAPALLRQLTMLIAYLEPGQASFGQPDAHHGEECLFVLTGRLTATIGGHTAELDAGDTIYFDARVPHQFRNDGADEAQVLVALLYPPGPPRLAGTGARANGSARTLAHTGSKDSGATRRRPGRSEEGAQPR